MPILGILPAFGRDPLGFLARCAREYGDVVRLRFPRGQAYLVCHPSAIESVLATDHRSFVKDNGFRTPVMRRVFGQGLLTSEGEHWLRHRKLIQPAFHRDRMPAYAEAVVRSTERMLAGWTPGETRDAHTDAMRLTLDIVAQTLFETEVPEEIGDLGDTSEIIKQQFSTQMSISGILMRLLRPGGPRAFHDTMDRLDAVVYRSLRARAAEQGNGVVSLMLRAQDEQGIRLSDQELRDEVMTLFLAGHDTTALALSWTWYLLSQSPDVEAVLCDELADVLDGRPPTFDDLPQLRYTECVVRESMRLYPPAWVVTRQAAVDCEVGGYPCPADTAILMSQWLTHRDPRFYEQAGSFKPERWLDDLAKRLPRGAYFPFGGGPRTCIGNTFAVMEATLIVAAVYRRFHLALIPGHPVVPWPSITLEPRAGMRMTIERRGWDHHK